MSLEEVHAQGRVLLRRDVGFNAVKVFSATMFADRGQLGEKVTAWIAQNPQLKLVEIFVTQSSDASYHCIAITVFYREAPRA
jgi:hypothetical protein